MTYYHATSLQQLSDVLECGLGGTLHGRTKGAAGKGIPLATDARLSITVALIHDSDNEERRRRPELDVGAWRIVVIEDDKIDPSALDAHPDCAGWSGCYAYHGELDVAKSPILKVTDIAYLYGKLPDGTPSYPLSDATI